MLMKFFNLNVVCLAWEGKFSCPTVIRNRCDKKWDNAAIIIKMHTSKIDLTALIDTI